MQELRNEPLTVYGDEKQTMSFPYTLEMNPFTLVDLLPLFIMSPYKISKQLIFEYLFKDHWYTLTIINTLHIEGVKNIRNKGFELGFENKRFLPTQKN